jgi:hypothetical protein
MQVHKGPQNLDITARVGWALFEVLTCSRMELFELAGRLTRKRGFIEVST